MDSFDFALNAGFSPSRFFVQNSKQDKADFGVVNPGPELETCSSAPLCEDTVEYRKPQSSMQTMEIRDNRVSATKVLRALSARFLFAAHGLLCIWRVASIYSNSLFWCFGLILVFIFVEGAVLIFYRRANESRWFCPSVFLYLCAVAPCLWFLQLELCRKSVQDLASNTTVATSHALNQDVGEAATFDFGGYTVTIYIPLEREVWVQLLQQTMLVTIILGRWILPKGDITRDHLSQLLLVFLAMAADMVELFDTFKESQVKYNLRLTCVVLAVWTVSTLQFPLVLTGRMRKPRFGSMKRYSTLTLQNVSRSSRSSSYYHMDHIYMDDMSFCQLLTTDINFWGVLTGTFLQDGPFLGTRLYLLIEHQTISYTMIFFTCKNILVVALQCYRLLVICAETGRHASRNKTLAESTVSCNNNTGTRTTDFSLTEEDPRFIIGNGRLLSTDRTGSRGDRQSPGAKLQGPLMKQSRSDGALLPGGRRSSEKGSTSTSPASQPPVIVIQEEDGLDNSSFHDL